MRIYSRGVPPSEEDIRREVSSYLEALAPLPAVEQEGAEFSLPAAPREDFID
jgi:hypothetical protein